METTGGEGLVLEVSVWVSFKHSLPRLLFVLFMWKMFKGVSPSDTHPVWAEYTSLFKQKTVRTLTLCKWLSSAGQWPRQIRTHPEDSVLTEKTDRQDSRARRERTTITGNTPFTWEDSGFWRMSDGITPKKECYLSSSSVSVFIWESNNWQYSFQLLRYHWETITAKSAIYILQNNKRVRNSL